MDRRCVRAVRGQCAGDAALAGRQRTGGLVMTKAYASKHVQQRLRGIHAMSEMRAAADLKGKPHRYKVFRLELDECAECQKPRSEHPRSEKRR